MGIDKKTLAVSKTYTNKVALGFQSVTQTSTGFKITFKDGTTATYNVQNMHEHANKSILDLLSVDLNGNLLYNGKSISPDFIDTTGDGGKFLANDGTYKTVTTGGVAYDDTQVKADIQTNANDIATNKTNIATNTSDISDLTTKIGTTAMGTTATDVTGAVKEINGNLLDTVSFSADYKNIVLNRKNGLNPYSIPISAIINHAKLIELGDIDVTDIGNGKTLVYDATSQKHKYVSSSGTDEFVKMDSTTDAHYLVDLLDKQTIVNENGVLKIKKLDGQEVTIAEINYLKGLTMNIMDLVNAFANGGVKVLNTPVATYADLTTLDRSTFIDGISYIVYVLADETHAGAKTTYLVDKTNTTFFGNADSQRNFTTDPIDLASEVTGKLGTSNIDVDSLWALLTVDDTYKTLTTTDNAFGTHGAKAMYDELVTAIGGKANTTDLTAHTDNTDIHVTTADKTKWDKVTDKVDTTDFDTLKNKVDEKVDKTSIITVNSSSATDEQVYSAKVINTELDKVVKKTDINTTIDSTSTDDTVPTNKAVFTSIDKIQGNLSTLDIITDLNNFKGTSFMIGRGTGNNNETANIPNGVTGAFVVEFIPYNSGENYGVQKLTLVQANNGKYSTFERSLVNGSWKNWQELATMDSRNIILGNDVFIGGESKQVKNGNIVSLQLQIWGNNPKTGKTVLVTNLYKPINKIKPTYFFDNDEANDVYNLQITKNGELVALNGFSVNTCFINVSYITSE